MKKLFVILIIVACFFTNASAQFISRGTTIASGGISLSSSKNKDSDWRYTDFTFAPFVAYFVANNFALGAEIDFGVSRAHNKDLDLTDASTSITIGPVVRYYLNNGIFFHVSPGFGVSSYKSDDGDFVEDNSSTETILSGMLAAGYAVKIGDRGFFEPMLGYKSIYYSSTDNGNNNSSTNNNLFIMGTFTIILGKK